MLYEFILLTIVYTVVPKALPATKDITSPSASQVELIQDQLDVTSEFRQLIKSFIQLVFTYQCHF